jgi:hypothetical protein
MSYPTQVIYSENIKAATAAGLQEKASRLFNKAVSRSAINRFWAKITGKPYTMVALGEFTRQGELLQGAYAGTRTVNIDDICGSEDRAADFDREFNPVSSRSRNRWINVARAWLSSQDMPPIELIEVDGRFFIRDGHHRISVAHSIGQRYVEAEVIRYSFRPPAM